MDAPLAVNDALEFKQTVGVAVVEIIAGSGLTVTGMVFEAEQPFKSVPVTV